MHKQSAYVNVASNRPRGEEPSCPICLWLPHWLLCWSGSRRNPCVRSAPPASVEFCYNHNHVTIINQYVLSIFVSSRHSLSVPVVDIDGWGLASVADEKTETFGVTVHGWEKTESPGLKQAEDKQCTIHETVQIFYAVFTGYFCLVNHHSRDI